MALGVARVVEIDAAGGPIFGAMTSQAREARFLGPKEVVLTFDDGPMPGITRSILDTLDRFCTKATFFSVGRMAVAHPALVREVLARGHTLGTHTWSHPLNLPRMSPERARDQIDSGFAAVALAAGAPIAPFFRFPGLSDSPVLLDHLQKRGIAAFTVDVVSNDSYIADPARLVARTLAHARAENGGILLFHDIKHVTARALPTILRELRAGGFSVVHMRAKTPFVPDERYVAAVRENM
jgi:peptidoglycan/xylan/chitin deacetylase (PgdA/CDA1 family)